MHYFLTYFPVRMFVFFRLIFINILRFLNYHHNNLVFLLIEFPIKRYYNDNAVFQHKLISEEEDAAPAV